MVRKSRSPRLYEPVWLLLKKDKEVTLIVRPHNLPKVKKAIIKEKDMDINFKELNEEVGDKVYLDISYNRSNYNLTLMLKQRIGIFGDIRT